MSVQRKKSEDLFVVYADEYDYITDADRREQYHGKEVATLIEKFSPTSVLDAGCASGLTSSLFAREGIRTMGIDRSLPMVRVAQKKYEATDWPLEFKTAHFEKIPQRMERKFDLVVCLANSISGVKTMSRLSQALANFRKCLKPDGHLVLQMLNFSSIREDILFPIRATRHENIVYQRFYERRGRRYYLYLTRMDLNDGSEPFEIFRVDFDNFTPDEILKAVKFSNFKDISRYSDLYLKKKFTARSRDLVIVARNAG